MKQRLLQSPNEVVTTISFSAAEMATLHWEDENEFYYRGEMYDVLCVEQNGTQSVIRCVADHKESALVDQYYKTQQGVNDNAPIKSIKKLMSADFLPTVPSDAFVTVAEKRKELADLIPFLPTVVQTIQTPPPQVAWCRLILI